MEVQDIIFNMLDTCSGLSTSTRLGTSINYSLHQAYRKEQGQVKERKAAKKKEKEEKEAADRALKSVAEESASLVTSELAATVENGAPESEVVEMENGNDSDTPQVVE